MALQFHQSTFDLLGVEPCVSEQRLAIIAAREKLCGVTFPKSIREWYSIEGVEKLFCENTNEDDLTKVSELGDPEEVNQGYLCVATENQAVVAWYARLDDTDDPPILDNNDEWDSDLSTINWQPCSTSFSNFIFDMISNFHFDGWRSGARLSAEDQFPDVSMIEQLRQRFQEGSTTDEPNSRVYRFFNIHGLIRIASKPTAPGKENAAEWAIETDSMDTLYEFARSIWGFYNLPKTLTAKSGLPESRAKGNEVLKRLRKNGPNQLGSSSNHWGMFTWTAIIAGVLVLIATSVVLIFRGQ